ncbi:MAG: helix-turn-helix transcriptional regulator [Cyanobacteria bacterium P01_A01_bin.123]
MSNTFMSSPGLQHQSVGQNELGGSLWEYRSGKPSLALADWVYSYGGYRENVGQPVRRLEVPKDRVMLILGFGDRLQIQPVGASPTSSQYGAFVVGFGKQPLVTKHDGMQSCIEVELPPWAVSQLLGTPAPEFTQGPIHLQDIWGNEAQLLIEQLSELPTWQARFAWVDRMLAEKASTFSTGVLPEIQWAWKQLDVHGGCLSIRQLAKTIGWSDRYFAVRFRKQVGITPKAAARRIRFNRSLRLLEAPDCLGLSAIAAICGYSDQSHFTREFHLFSGCSPRAYRSARFTDLLGTPSHIIDA